MLLMTKELFYTDYHFFMLLRFTSLKRHYYLNSHHETFTHNN